MASQYREIFETHPMIKHITTSSHNITYIFIISFCVPDGAGKYALYFEDNFTEFNQGNSFEMVN